MQVEEGTSMAKSVVQILLVILLVAAIVGVVYGAYNYFTRGADKMTGQMSSLDKSSLSQYDNQQVPGSTVLTTLKANADSDLAIFVCTTNSQNVASTTSSAYEAAETSNKAISANYCVLCDKDDSGNLGDLTSVQGSSATKYYKLEVLLCNNDNTKNVQNGCWYINSVHWGKGNAVQRNSNFSVTTDKSASATYVKQSSDFYANLVYDKSTGDICGILFRQMN